ncbi:ketopantoate reductase family protein [Jiangella gansuensis]|uniref:ketopantoate reductase family protein n=1 Tax=Jiangella gansuensis TaxID=281473 RepID=UPI00047EC5E7|nr:2-dehydropantoate 2-reductase [Jiangella gansuensis]
MKTLIVGIGALGGLIAARLDAAGSPAWLATRDEESAARLASTGLHVSGVGGSATASTVRVAALAAYGDDGFDLIVLATKARDAIEAAPRLADLLTPGGTVLPIQNGGVSQLLGDRLGTDRVLGGLSNLGATMTQPGVYEQRNAGHLLIGELGGGDSERAQLIGQWLGRAIEVRVTPNLAGAIWSKLVVNCSVTTIGAMAGTTMRDYVRSPDGRQLFDRTYDEALSVALASGAQPERMLVDPVPPGWDGQSVAGAAHDTWLGQVLDAYGDIKPSMLQDFERGRTTEIDFINGYVVDLGQRLGVPTPANAAIVETVHTIERGEAVPGSDALQRVLRTAFR